MVFKEAVTEVSGAESHSLQIFATDLSADAINVARRGHYPQRISDEVDRTRLSRFFTAQGSGFQINSEIREMVLFAQHDVILDPPFTKLDLLSCRNLMIYFNAALQSRLMPLFSYSCARVVRCCWAARRPSATRMPSSRRSIRSPGSIGAAKTPSTLARCTFRPALPGR
jgi:chemotaxis methyl-accepting protein methylase